MNEENSKLLAEIWSKHQRKWILAFDGAVGHLGGTMFALAVSYVMSHMGEGATDWTPQQWKREIARALAIGFGFSAAYLRQKPSTQSTK